MTTVDMKLDIETEEKEDKKFCESISIPIGPDDSLKGVHVYKDRIAISVFRKTKTMTKSLRKNVIGINTKSTQISFN